MWVGEETHHVPVNVAGIGNGLNKLWKYTKPFALLLSPWLSNMDLFLSTLQRSYVLNLVSPSVCFMMLQLERLRWDRVWDCVWKIRQDPKCWAGLSAWAGWGAVHELLQMKNGMMWGLVVRWGWKGGVRGNKEINIFWTPLDFWVDHSLYKSLKPGEGT